MMLTDVALFVLQVAMMQRRDKHHGVSPGGVGTESVGTSCQETALASNPVVHRRGPEQQHRETDHRTKNHKKGRGDHTRSVRLPTRVNTVHTSVTSVMSVRADIPPRSAHAIALHGRLHGLCASHAFPHPKHSIPLQSPASDGTQFGSIRLDDHV